MAWSWHGIYLRPKEVKYKICSDLSWMASNSKHLYWDIISKIAQNSACDMFPESRSYLMKRFNLFFGDVLRDWLLKQDVWLTIFFISKQFLVKNLHDQDQIWWKVWNFSSETFLVKVDLSKIVNLAWTVLTLAWTTRNGLTCWIMTCFSLSIMTIQDLLIFWRELTLNGEESQPDNGMKLAWNLLKTRRGEI